MSKLNTKMQNLREKGNLDKWEIRLSTYGGLKTFIDQTNSPSGIITPELKAKATKSIGFQLETAVIEDNPNLTIGNTRELVIADALNTSRMVVFNFTTYSHGFTMVPTEYHNNEIGYERDWEASYKFTNRLFGEALNDAALAKLEGERSKVISEPLLYTELANTIIAKYNQRFDVLNDTPVIMKGNDFNGEIYLVHSTSFEAIVREIMKYGQNNERDEQKQLLGTKFYPTNALSPGVGKYASAYAVLQDSVGMLFRHEREAVAGRITADGHEWAVDELDAIGVPISTYYHESVGNETARGGAATADMDRVFKEHYGFAIDACFHCAFISDKPNRATPVLKLQVNRSETDSDTTSPTVTTVTSSALTGAVVTFSEVVCTDEQGTVISGDIADLFSISAGTIDSATASADGTQVTFVISGSSNGATISIDDNSIYDGAGNKFDQANNPIATAASGSFGA